MRVVTSTMLIIMCLAFGSISAHADSASGSDASWLSEWRDYWREWRSDNYSRNEWRNLAREERRAIKLPMKKTYKEQWRRARQVPEIDGAGLPLAIGLLAGIFGLVRERCRRGQN